jgi:hypothetical protein
MFEAIGGTLSDHQSGIDYADTAQFAKKLPL